VFFYLTVDFNATNHVLDWFHVTLSDILKQILFLTTKLIKSAIWEWRTCDGVSRGKCVYNCVFHYMLTKKCLGHLLQLCYLVSAIMWARIEQDL